MKGVNYAVEYDEHAGRLELIVRWLWAIPSVIVLSVLGIIATFAWLIQWLYILVTGKRNRMLHDWLFKYCAYFVKLQAYMDLVSEERNPIMPEA
ncbi:Uncharacterised protein [Candidatus Burarchaeum australiense]|nr:Uncharacterised protein [Candidatus Burarchaeum australiense]